MMGRLNNDGLESGGPLGLFFSIFFPKVQETANDAGEVCLKKKDQLVWTI